MVKVSQILEWLNELAPFDRAESFDNVGLLMGDPATDVSTVLFGMDVTDALADEAVRLGAEVIITHHPFIFHGIKRIDYAGPQGKTICRLASQHINVIAAHTNWDKAPGGVGDSLAQALELANVTAADEYIRIGDLPSPMSHDLFAAYVRDKLSISPRMYPASKEPISRVAVAGGAYGEGYLAALGAHAYVVGEVAHHEILDASMRGLTICDAGHFATEWPGVKALYQRFLTDADACGWSVCAHLHNQAPYHGAILAL